METIQKPAPPERMWRWCLAGNIVEEHPYGEARELRRGSRPFRPGAKVYVNLVFGGMGHEHILVIGTPRHTKRYIEIVIARRRVERLRLQKVFRPAVLRRMEQSEWDWWGDTDAVRDRLIQALEWLNPAEAERARDRKSVV